MAKGTKWLSSSGTSRQGEHWWQARGGPHVIPCKRLMPAMLSFFYVYLYWCSTLLSFPCQIFYLCIFPDFFFFQTTVWAFSWKEHFKKHFGSYSKSCEFILSHWLLLAWWISCNWMNQSVGNGWLFIVIKSDLSTFFQNKVILEYM